MDTIAPLPALPAPRVANVGDVGRFILECMPSAKGARADASAVYERFEQWCSQDSLDPMPPREFALAFKTWCDRAGIRARRDDSKGVYFVDVKLAN